MYERLRNKYRINLLKNSIFTNEQIEFILEELDLSIKDFEVIERETALSNMNQTIPDEVKIFLSSKIIDGCSKETIYNYSRFLKIFFQKVNKRPSEISVNDIRLFLHLYQNERKISMRSLDKVRCAISSFFSWLCIENYIETNPCKNIKKLKYEEKPRQSLSQYDMEYMRNACENNRDKAVLEFLYSSGCRVSEICNIKLTDVDFTNKTVSVLGKGKKHRIVFISVKCEILLREYIKTRHDDCEYLFTTMRRPYTKLTRSSIEKRIKKIYDNVDYTINKNVTPHVLRHTFATTMLNHGVDVTNIRTMLGHADISTTMIYAKNDLKNAKNEYDKFM